MKRARVVLFASLLLGGAWLFGSVPARAGDVSIAVGTGFRVGGTHFRVAYSTGGHTPYYLRVSTPLYYPGFDCTPYCRIGPGRYDHAPYCPVVHHHFARFGYVGPYVGEIRWHRHRRHHHHAHPGWHRGYGSYRHHGARGHGRHHRSRSQHGYWCAEGHSHRRGAHGQHRRAHSGYDDRFKGGHRSGRAPGAANRTRPQSR